MKKNIFKTIVFSFLSFSAFAQKDLQRVLVIGLDGFSAEGFKASKHPNIDKMLSDGIISLTTRPVMPSVTLPNWTSHFTGSGPEEHGVTGNDWTLEKHPLLPLQKDEDGYYPSIFKVLKDQIPEAKIAYYYNWKELINPINKNYIDEVYFEEKDQFNESYTKAFDFLKTNRNKPTLVFLYSVHTDHAGHSFGWMSLPYIKAIEDADLAIGVLIDKLKAENIYKGTHFMLITDHGGLKTGHGGVSMLEMQVPWGIVGPTIRSNGLISSFNSNKNTSIVLAKIFGLKNLPGAWTGTIPNGVFKK